jgi:hypothetical protein
MHFLLVPLNMNKTRHIFMYKIFKFTKNIIKKI